jgi:hypothetical protein
MSRLVEEDGRAYLEDDRLHHSRHHWSCLGVVIGEDLVAVAAAVVVVAVIVVAVEDVEEVVLDLGVSLVVVDQASCVRRAA